MSELKHPGQIQIVEPFIFFVLAIIVIIYSINALNTQDWLWFASGNADAGHDYFLPRGPKNLVVWCDAYG
jgi:hypothetical protein